MIKHTLGPWEGDDYGGSVYNKAGKVCDIRGWGRLTGKGTGGLGLSEEEAIIEQKEVQRLIAAAPVMLDALIEFVKLMEGPLKTAEMTVEQMRGLMDITDDYVHVIEQATGQTWQEVKSDD